MPSVVTVVALRRGCCCCGVSKRQASAVSAWLNPLSAEDPERYLSSAIARGMPVTYHTGPWDYPELILPLLVFCVPVVMYLLFDAFTEDNQFTSRKKFPTPATKAKPKTS